MRKSIFIIAALFAATFANAQITLKKTLDGWYSVSADPYGDMYNYVQAPYFYNQILGVESNTCVIYLYDVDDFSLYKTININSTINRESFICLVSKNILSVDNKVCFCISKNAQSEIYNEDGVLISTINGSSPSLVWVNDRYLLLSRGYENGQDKTYIYSVPGNGETQAISTPSSPKRNARKIAREGQVLVETENNTYTLQGQEVK